MLAERSGQPGHRLGQRRQADQDYEARRDDRQRCRDLGQEADHPVCRLRGPKQGGPSSESESDAGERRGQAESIGNHQEEAEPGTAERDSAQEDKKGGGAWYEATDHAHSDQGATPWRCAVLHPSRPRRLGDQACVRLPGRFSVSRGQACA
jgi:hypothetical protein